MKVKFGVTLQQIIGIDEKKQILMSNIWHNLEWHDPYMQWNESEYGNIKDIRYLNIRVVLKTERPIERFLIIGLEIQTENRPIISDWEFLGLDQESFLI